MEEGAASSVKNLPVGSQLPSRFAAADQEELMPAPTSKSFTISRVVFLEPNWMIDGEIREKNQGALLSSEQEPLTGYTPRPLLVPPPKTLKTFRELWDALNEEHSLIVPTRLSTTYYHLNDVEFFVGGRRKLDSTPVRWQKATGVQNRRPVRFALGLLERRLSKEFPAIPNKYIYYAVDSRKLIGPEEVGFFPVTDYQPWPFDAQQSLIQKFPKDRRPPHGSFEYSFRALNAFTKNYQGFEIPLGAFDTILASEQSRTGESFEAFGVKFPAQGTTRWGILVVLGIQLYLFIHLRELAGKLNPEDAGWDVAWIGVYDSTLSKRVFAFSAFWLPIGAVAALAIRGLYISDFAKLYWAILCCGVIASVTLSVAGWRHSQNLHHRASTTDLLP